MIKNNKINARKMLKKCSIITALLSLLIVPFIAIGASNNQLSQQSNATYNDDANVASTKNIEHRNWDSQSSDFLLNANNAITLNQNVNYKSSTSIVNGPEGFLANYNNQLSYIGYDGVLKWNAPSIEFNNSDKLLISSYYNSYSNSFVILYSTSNTTILAATISADNGQVLAISTAITTTNVARYLLVPVNNSAGNNEVSTYAIISKSSVSANSRILTSIVITQQGLIDSQTTIGFVDTPGSEQTNYMILSSGAIVFGNVSYYFFLSSFQDGRVWLRVFAQNNKELNFLTNTRVLNDWNTNYVDTVLDSNIPEIWVSTKNNQIEIAAFLNAIPSKPWLFGATVSLSPPLANLKINSIDLSDVNIVSFNIQNARFYGNYLYGYLTQGNQNYIIRLKVSDQDTDTWNPAGLTWDPNDVDYTNNDRIILYDISYANTNANIIAQPIYQAASNYSGNNQLFVMDTKATNLWLLDGTKPAFAYDTWAKKDIANIAIAGVSDIFVADADSDLKAYFTNASLPEYFSQYQTPTTYTIEKKTSTDVTIEHAKGNLPATLVIEKGYDSNGFAPVTRSFDIVLTGFKNFKTSLDSNPTPKIALGDTLAQSIKSNAPINATLKTYLLENVILPKNTLNEADIASIEVESYNNITGTLVLRSITLNRYYATGGILETTAPFTFRQEITINGFKEINPTAIVANSSFTFNELNAFLASEFSESQLQQLIFSKRNEIFVNLPDDFVANNIIAPWNIIDINDAAGSLNVSFNLDNYYDTDGIGTLTTSPKIFGPITITGFNQLTYKTSINLNPTKTTDLENILAQTVDLSNETFKRYLLEHVIIDPSQNIKIENIASIQIKDNSFNNIDGTLVLESITLNKWYDDKSILQNTDEEFHGEINLQGFKKIHPTAIVANSSFTFNELNEFLASEFSESQLQQLIFAKRTEIFITNSLPDDFAADNIIAPWNITDINDATGTLNVSFDLNNYYDNDTKGTLKKAPNKSFGSITITGFNQLTYKTSINLNPTKTTDLENILAQTVDLSNETFKRYLLEHVIIDPSQNIKIENITSIQIKDNSFNNIDGTLVLESITLNKWYDDKSILQNTEEEFHGEINLQGFKKIIPTALKKNPDPNKLLDVDGEYHAVKANEVTPEQIWEIILAKKNEIFADNSLPDNIESSIPKNIYPSIYDAKIEIGTVEIKFDLTSFYSDDPQGTWINNKIIKEDPDFPIYEQKEFGPLIISGFTDLSTFLVQPAELINLNEYPYEMIDLNQNDIIKNFIFDNVMETKEGLNPNDINLINWNSYDNKEGILKINWIQLTRYVGADGKTVIDQIKIFYLLDASGNPIPIEIKGFKKVAGPTEANHNPVTVGDGLETIKIKDLVESDNQKLLEKWIEENKDVLILNLPDKPNPSKITIKGYDDTISDTPMGVLAIKLEVSSYYNTDALYTYENQPETFTVVLNGFKTDVQTGFNDITSFEIEGMSGILAQTISPNMTSINILDAFKKELINKLITGKKDNIEIGDFSGTYNNNDGTYTLTSISLNLTYDEQGNVSPGILHTFSPGIIIEGFKKINPTAIVANSSFTFDELNAFLASEFSESQLQQLIFAKRNEIFITNSLPDDFAADNIIAPWNIADINDATGSLNVSFYLDNYYDTDGIGTLTTSPKIFGPITITGFDQSANSETEIQSSNVSVDIDILPQIFIKDTSALANPAFRQYLFEHVIRGGKIDKNDIESINFRPNSFNNIDGTLVLESITLNKWYDDKSILQTGSKKFEGDITIGGFKKINSTDLKNPAEILWDNFDNLGWWQDIESDYSDKLSNFIFAKRTNIFIDNSLPDSFTFTNIKISSKPLPSSLTEELVNVKFQLDNYYADDAVGTLTTTDSPTEFSLNIRFKASLATEIPPVIKADIGGLSQTYFENILNGEGLKQLEQTILDYLNENSTDQDPDKLLKDSDIELDIIDWNNREGEITIKIKLNRSFNYKGVLVDVPITSKEQTIISGFTTIVSPTEVKHANTIITGNLSKSDVNAITKEKLDAWIIDHKNDIFNSLPADANIQIVNFTPFPEEGRINVSVKIDKYYKDNPQHELITPTSNDHAPLDLSFNVIGFVKINPFPIIPVSLGAGAAVIVTIIAIATIIYFYRKKKYKTTQRTSE